MTEEGIKLKRENEQFVWLSKGKRNATLDLITSLSISQFINYQNLIHFTNIDFVDQRHN